MNNRMRDRIVIAAGLLLVGVLALTQIVILPTMRDNEKLTRAVRDGQPALEQLRARAADYTRLSAALAAAKKKVPAQSSGPGPLAVLEDLAKKCGLGANVPYMKPENVPVAGNAYTQTKVTVRVENVTLPQVAQFLTRIQYDTPLGVRGLQIKTGAKTATLLDATIELVHIGPPE